MADITDEYLNMEGVGTVVREPRTFTTKSGKKVCKFTVKCNGKYQDVTAWERFAEMSADLRPGEKVKVYGTPSTEEWTDKEGNKRVRLALNLNRLARNLDNDRSADFAEYGPAVPTPQVKTEEPMPDDRLSVADDIPF